MINSADAKTVIASLRGGLANQMGIYAAASALAERHRAQLKLDLSYFVSGRRRNYELDKLQVPAEIATKREVNKALGSRFKFFQKRRRAYYESQGLADPQVYRENLSASLNHDPKYFERCPAILFGDFPSIWYYEGILPRLRTEFEIAKPLSPETAQWLARIQQTSSISLHVRRGDYATNAKTTQLHGLLGVEYYQAAIDLMESLVPEGEFFIFSDDMPWARQSLRSNRPLHHVACNSIDAGYQDFHLMKNCRHHIIANSGFSRWPALLNESPGKRVIMPKRWVVAHHYDEADIAPPEWIRL